MSMSSSYYEGEPHSSLYSGESGADRSSSAGGFGSSSSTPRSSIVLGHATATSGTSPPSHEGFLAKRVSTHNAWRRRYFKIRNLTLAWYKNKQDAKPRGSISLAHCSVRVLLAQDRMGDRQWRFELSSKEFGRVYHLQAETRHELQRWVNALNACASYRMDGLQEEPAPDQDQINNILFYDCARSLFADVCVLSVVCLNFGVLFVFDCGERIDFSFGEEWRKKAGLPGRASQWRQTTSLCGISSSAAHALETVYLEDGLQLPSASCMAMHNSKNLVAIANSPYDKKATVQIVSAPDGFDNDFVSVRKFVQTEGISDMSWRDSSMLAATKSGNVHLYNLEPDKGSRNISLKASFSHSKWMGEHSAEPGEWLHSTRINSVKINSLEPTTFVSLENQRMHVWDMDRHETPTFSGKASTSPIFAGEWSPHNPAHLMVGGLNKSLKLFDVRSLTKAPERAVVWKMTNAHDDIVRGLSWSPLMPHWVASAGDDGCVQVWDLRMNKTYIRTLRSHTSAVHNVCWSRSQAEVLCSGSIDRTVRLWNLCLGPHYIMNTHTELGGSIVGAEFSNQEPMTILALSSSGSLVSLRMTSTFSERFTQHRFSEDENEEREIEALLYGRDIGLAFERIAELATKYWENNKYEKTARLLALCSSTMFESCTSRAPKSQTKLIRDLAYYIPPNALLKSSVPEKCTRRIQVLRIRLALRKLLEGGKYADILSLEDDVCNHLREDGNAFAVSTLREIIELVLPHNYIRALRLALRLAEILRDHGRFNHFVDVSALLLQPTIYHEQPDQPKDFVTEAHLVKKASVALDRDLRNPKIVIPQLDLLYQVHVALELPDASLHVIDIMEDAHKVLPASVHRLYFNALIQKKNYDKFFILATQLVQLVDGYPFSAIIRTMMDEVGFPRLKRFLETYSRPEASDDGDLSRFISGSLTIINMIQNCVSMPTCLNHSLPRFLKKYTVEFERALKGLSDKEAAKHAENVLSLVARIKDNKRTSSAFFVDEFTRFTNMLQGFIM